MTLVMVQHDPYVPYVGYLALLGKSTICARAAGDLPSTIKRRNGVSSVLVNCTFEALAHVRRREVLRILRNHDRLSAGQLAEQLAVPRPTLSGHLNILKGADLIIGDREGTTIWYRLNMTVIEEAIELVLSLLSRDRTAPTPSLAPPATAAAGGRISAGDYSPVHTQ